MKGQSNYLFRIQYDGTRYEGWQKQKNTDRTIQGKLERVLEEFCGFPTEVCGSGRTDAGVHALGQMASVRLPEGTDPEEIMKYANHYLPEDIRILAVSQVPDRFHARLSAVWKTYCYHIDTGSKKDVFERKYTYGFPFSLDVEKMRQAARLLEGTHDFKSFCSNKKMKKSTVRTLYEIRLTQLPNELQIDYRGEGFLYNMVRILTGTLIEVGRGDRKPEEIPGILEGRDRGLAGFTAPARGLTLVEVRY